MRKKTHRVGGKLHLARKDGDQWTVFNAGNSPLLHNHIRAIDLDSDGHVWINNSSTQTSLAAIFEYDGQNWRSFSVPNDLPWSAPWRELSGLLVDGDDHVWVSNSFESGVAEFDGQTWTLRGQSMGQVDSMIEDLDGNLWFAAGFLYKYDGVVFEPHSVVGTLTALAAGDNGRVWVGSYSNVIYTPDGGANWFLYTQAPITISSVAPQPGSGNVWITSIGAVRHHGPNGQWIEAFNSYNSGLPDYFIDGTSTDRSGNLWFASGEEGASRFDGSHWRNWGSHNPNIVWPSLAEGAYGAEDGSAGNVWIGTQGILRWAGGDLDYWPIGLTFKYFAEDGTGTVWAGGGASLYTFQNENWVLNLIVDPIVGMEVDGQGRL